MLHFCNNLKKEKLNIDVHLSVDNKTLGEEKYAISRIMESLEKEGFLDWSSPGHPVLTESGKKETKYYAERVRITIKCDCGNVVISFSL